MISRSTGMLRHSGRAPIAFAVAAAALTGCSEELTTGARILPGQPDTAGSAVWQYLQNANYETQWQTWPGKGKLYAGQQPHGILLTTYLNDVAYAALTAKAGRFPPGAIIVKENYMPDSTLAAVTTMYKVQGYNPSAADWFWVKHLPDGTVDQQGAMQGRVAMCIGCHAARAANDYIYTGSLSAAPCTDAGAAVVVNATDGLRFSPQNVTITAGQTVCWQNTGGVFHTVTSDDGTTFNSNLDAGARFLHTFGAAGSFPYHCIPHRTQGMVGTVTVQ